MLLEDLTTRSRGADVRGVNPAGAVGADAVNTVSAGPTGAAGAVTMDNYYGQRAPYAAGRRDETPVRCDDFPY